MLAVLRTSGSEELMDLVDGDAVVELRLQPAEQVEPLGRFLGAHGSPQGRPAPGARASPER
jgi:hypothetical protein